MVRRLFTLIIIGLLLSCSGRTKTPILVPELSFNFYEDALRELNDQLEKKPQEEELITQKLFYCKELNWPTTCKSALDIYRSQHGMDYQLVTDYIAYYKRHERYQLLLETIETWNSKYKLEENFIETYIESLAQIGRSKEVVVALRAYLKSRNSAADLAFAARQYLQIQNRPLALFTLSKLFALDPTHPLVWNYGRLLLQAGQEEVGSQVLRTYVDATGNELEKRYVVAQQFYKMGRFTEARAILGSTFEEDSVALFYADLLQAEGSIDSATMVLKSLVDRDSTKSEPVWRLAELHENRGWLSTAADYYSLLVERNSEDTLAVKKLAEVQRKIAYLQRKKFEDQQRAIPVIQPKKIENNE